MTLLELHVEYQYRYDERIGILCDDRTPTPEQIEIATSEAEAFLKETTKPLIPATQVEMKL